MGRSWKIRRDGGTDSHSGATGAPIYTYYRRIYAILALGRATQAYQARLFVRLVGTTGGKASWNPGYRRGTEAGAEQQGKGEDIMSTG
jgi:hypothetical protein